MTKKKKQVIQEQAEPEQFTETLESAPIITFDWREFLVYGVIWIVILSLISTVFAVGNIIREQNRQIQDLVNRLNRYENPDWNDGDGDNVRPDDKDEDKDSSTLSVWVKKNLPAKGIEERPAVAEVFWNIADMLEAGTLTGEQDTFAEGIAQLQPVATRSVWLPFLTGLTKRLKAAKLDAAGLAAALRTVSKAIYSPPKVRENPTAERTAKAKAILEQGVKGLTPPDTPDFASKRDSAPVGKLPSAPVETPQTNKEAAPIENKPEVVEEPAKQAQKPKDEPKRAAPTQEQNSCPNGNCPTGTCPNYNGGYGNAPMMNWNWRIW